MKSSALVISLDFELLWGVFDKVNFQNRKKYFENTKELIPQILKLFTEYQTHATWATVGMLDHSNWEEWTKSFPEALPGYDNDKLSAYLFGQQHQENIPKSICFAPELIDKIQNTPNQEFATHTYAHYYCLENGQNIEQFRADLRKCIELANHRGVKIKSLVFPRNQFNENYLGVCKEFGITSVRINPTNWYWSSVAENSLKNKIFRTGDAYIGFNDKSYSVEEIELFDASISLQKASRFLRPRAGKLNKLRLQRIKNEMLYAAKKKEIYHLWWHPHNFGDHPNESLEDLKEILSCYKHCEKKYGMQSLTMNEIHQYRVNSTNL